MVAPAESACWSGACAPGGRPGAVPAIDSLDRFFLTCRDMWSLRCLTGVARVQLDEDAPPDED
eukprot:3885216-Pyramimonas_sp.AAC.3